MFRIAFLTLLICSSLLGADEIIIQLDNEQKLAPLALYPIRDEQSELSSDYLKSLDRILHFDLNHNGRTVCDVQNPVFVVQPTLRGKTLSLSLQLKKSETAKRIDGIFLTGNLAKDRQQIHLAADSIHKAFFGKPGICNSRILFTTRNRKGAASSDWVSEVWSADYDGGNAKQLTSHTGLCVTPTFVPTPPGTRPHYLLYVCYETGQPKIYATSIKDTTVSRLTFMRGNQLMPTISPQGNLLAFISDVTGNPDLFIQHFSSDEGLQGKPRQIFCAPNAAQGSPTFSPDGKKLAFVSNKDGPARIYVLDIPLEGTSVKQLAPRLISKRNTNNTCPAWSPDGTKIAYSATTAGTRQIWIYDFTLQKEWQLTDGYGHKENPTWGPDSLHLLFNSSTPTTSELFLTNLNQKSATKITSGPGEKRFPAWEPLTMRTL